MTHSFRRYQQRYEVTAHHPQKRLATKDGKEAFTTKPDIVLVAAYRDSAPKLADWLETAIPEGLAVFALPERHQKRMRTSNPMERSIQQEIKRRTVKVRVFPNEASLERLVTAILVEIDEKWETTEKPYITWKAEDD